jgi:hypothetical protein
MRPGGVEVLPSLRDGAAGVVGAEEQALIQQLVAHPAVEALDIAGSSSQHDWKQAAGFAHERLWRIPSALSVTPESHS